MGHQRWKMRYTRSVFPFPLLVSAGALPLSSQGKKTFKNARCDKKARKLKNIKSDKLTSNWWVHKMWLFKLPKEGKCHSCTKSKKGFKAGTWICSWLVATFVGLQECVVLVAVAVPTEEPLGAIGVMVAVALALKAGPGGGAAIVSSQAGVVYEKSN